MALYGYILLFLIYIDELLKQHNSLACLKMPVV